jgi:hypothetical protein
MGEVGKSYEYDFIQRNIKGNHIALVELGRAGAIARIQIDSADRSRVLHVDNAPSIIAALNRKRTAMQIVMDGRVLTIDGDDAESVKKYLDSLKAEADSAKAKVTTLEADKAALEGKVAGLESKTRDLETRTTDSAAIEKEVSDRLATLTEVAGVTIDGFDPTLSAIEIKRKYLADKHPEMADRIRGGSAEFIDGMYSIDRPAPKRKTDEQKRAIDSMGTSCGSEESEEDRAMKEYMAERENQWKNKK